MVEKNKENNDMFSKEEIKWLEDMVKNGEGDMVVMLFDKYTSSPQFTMVELGDLLKSLYIRYGDRSEVFQKILDLDGFSFENIEELNMVPDVKDYMLDILARYKPKIDRMFAAEYRPLDWANLTQDIYYDSDKGEANISLTIHLNNGRTNRFSFSTSSFMQYIDHLNQALLGAVQETKDKGGDLEEIKNFISAYNDNIKELNKIIK